MTIRLPQPSTTSASVISRQFATKSSRSTVGVARRVNLLLLISLTLVALAFLPVLRAGGALEGGLTLDRLQEAGLIVAGFGMVAIGMHSARHRLHLQLWMQWPVLAFSAWCIISAFWSPAPQLTLSKAIELAAISIGTLVFTAGLDRVRTTSFGLTEYLAIALMLLVLAGLAANLAIWGSPLALRGVEGFNPRPRLQFAHGHPGVLGDVAAMAILAMFLARFSLCARLAGLAFLGYVLILTDSRASTAALAVALLAILLLRSGLRARLVIAYGVAIALAGYYWSILSRNVPEGPDWLGPIRPLLPNDLETFNGRTYVWELAWTKFLDSPIVGHGYYSTRYLILSSIDWAGDTHNNWLEIALTTGAIGLALLVIFVVRAYLLALSTRNLLLIGVLVYMTCLTITSIPFFAPTLPGIVLLLSINEAYTLGRARSSDTAGSLDTPPIATVSSR